MEHLFTGNSCRPLAPVQTRAANNRNMTNFATGLLIGAAEGDEVLQKRKEHSRQERYRKELLEQMAEQRRNKEKEKELELRVAATGAILPEKEYLPAYLPDLPQPDRIKQFGAVRREHEGRRRDVPYKPGTGLDTLGGDVDKRTHEVERGLPEQPSVASQSRILEYSTALGHLGNTVSPGVGNGGIAAFRENFHKGLSRTIGEMVAPRVARAPPPLAPTLAEPYSTPYDEAYYCSRARNPLDPNLTFYGPPAVQPSPNVPARALTSVHQSPAGDFAHPLAPVQTRAANKRNVTNFATGLLIGAAEGDEVLQKRKEHSRQERYRQELLEQMAEQRRNKENPLAPVQTKAADKRNVTNFATGLLIGAAEGDEVLQKRKEHSRQERYRQELLEQMAEQRRNKENFQASQHGISSGIGIGTHPSNRHQHLKDHALSYKDTLEQQIEERQERRRREKEEKERYDAKLEKEMKAYEPWGRGGGGAPLRADQGNLISDLKCLHRTNEEACVNAESCNRRSKASVDWTGATSRAEEKGSLHRVSDDKDSSFTRPSPYARGNVFSELPTPQHLRKQEKYKESLKQQIEEKRQIEAEWRERLKLEEEKRLAEERVHMQRWFEEEQGKERRKEVEVVSISTPQSPPVPAQRNQIRAADSSFTRPSPHARGNVFSELPTPQHLRKQEKYKESLKQQIVEKRQFEAEQRERLRLEAENEEKRLTEERAHMQRRFEEEQEKERRKEVEINAGNQEIMRQAEERRKEGERKRKEEEEKEARQQCEQGKQARLEQDLRSRSPPVPALQKRLGHQVPPRPPSVDSQRSTPASSINAGNQEIMRQAEERRKEGERKRKEEEEKDARQQCEQGKQARLEQDLRSRSPPVPALQKRLGHQVPPRPPSVDSQRSTPASSVGSISTPQSPPVPAQRNQIRAAEEQQGVIRELSVLRRILESKQKRLEGQLLQSNREDTQTPWKKGALPVLNGFDKAWLQIHARVRRPPSNPRPLNKQIIYDFNQLKYRGEISADEDDDLWQQTPSPPPGHRVSTTTVATEAWLHPGTSETLKKLMADRRLSIRDLRRDERDVPSTHHG